MEAVFVPYGLCDLLTGARRINQIEICQGQPREAMRPWQIFNSLEGVRE